MTTSHPTGRRGSPASCAAGSVPPYVEKHAVGRLSIEGGTLVIRTGVKPRWFCMPLEDVATVLEGYHYAVFLSLTGDTVGMARLPASAEDGNDVSFIFDKSLMIKLSQR